MHKETRTLIQTKQVLTFSFISITEDQSLSQTFTVYISINILSKVAITFI